MRRLSAAIGIVVLALSYAPQVLAQGEQPPMGKAAWSHVSEHRIVIGTAASFHEFNERNVEDFYTEYVATAKAEHPETDASISMEDLSNRYAGWIKVKYDLGATGQPRAYMVALVPVPLSDQIESSSTVDAVLLGKHAGDLVGATNNADGMFVIDTILCKAGPAFQMCARKYERGYFDAETGYQLTSKFTPMVPGRNIDVNTYEIAD